MSHVVSKGFLVAISASNIDHASMDQFSESHHWQHAHLAYDKNYSKNVIFDIKDNDFTIYIGDRHLNQKPETFFQALTHQDFNSFVGTKICFQQSTAKIEIMSDFLGSESVYYYQDEKTLWISDRIENFSRFLTVSQSESQIYTSVLMGATIADTTIFQNVRQTRPLQKVVFDAAINKLYIENNESWKSDPDADVDALYQQIDERLYSVLQQSPDSILMLSAGWDSRVLMAHEDRIKQTYTHGDLTSREVKIAFKLGSSMNVPLSFVPLQESSYGAEVSYEMLAETGQCLFPHWYHASKVLAKNTSNPLSAGLMVEHFSGHYGINSLPGSGRLKRLFESMVLPDKYDKIENREAVDYLSPALANGFTSLPWFFSNKVDFSDINKQFRTDTKNCLSDYVDLGTSGIQELSERFKIEHALRQYFSYQTKSACANLGYHHPFIDAQLAKLVLTLKYRHRISYKLSRHVVKSRAEKLLDVPMAATLVKGRAPIVMQEASRIARIGGELIYSKATGKLPKGLGWNNFQFLNKTNAFHEYADMLKDDIWDKPKIHQFIADYCQQDSEAYSLLIMLTKMVTTDFKLHPTHYF